MGDLENVGDGSDKIWVWMFLNLLILIKRILNMSSESIKSFSQTETLISSAAMNQNARVFPPGPVYNVSMGNCFGADTATQMLFPGSTNPVAIDQVNIAQASSSCSPYNTTLTINYENNFVEWTSEEQQKLDEGLVKYSSESNIMKYVKIAANLQDKTVRDVALRCRWMMRKRRKQDDCNTAKQENNRKDRLRELSSKTSLPLVSPLKVLGHSLFTHPTYRNDHASCDVSGPSKHLLEETSKIFDQIVANFSVLKLHENIELFYRARSNINTFLSEMCEVPGIMRQMPPLSERINEEISNIILPISSQRMMMGSTVGVKHEPN